MLSDMNEFEVQVNKDGVNQLLHCAEVRDYIEQLAQEQKARAGEGYKYKIMYANKDKRVTAIVKTSSDKAKQDNLDNNTLLKSTQG